MASDNTFSVQRSAEIAAPAETVFGFIDDFHEWALWSPWEKIDADLAKTYSGPESGVGAVYEWLGKKTGQGRMQITASAPASSVEIDLGFIKPFKADNKAVFTLAAHGASTHVTWTMTGQQNFMMKLMGVFFNMDKTVGKDFETGLASLKAVSEAKAGS